MEALGVARCQSCNAVVNVRWEACAVCKRPLHAAERPKPITKATDWLAAWRELAAITSGITADDPRFHPVMAALDRCDVAYLANDWPEFQKAAERVKAVMGVNHG